MAEKSLVPVKDYAITNGAEELQMVLRENLAGEKMSAMDFEQIKIPSGSGIAWTIPTLEGSDVKKDFTGVIIYKRAARGFWETSYEENPGQPPMCSSEDGEIGIGTPGGDCESCPMDKFKSDKDQRGKACKERRFVFVLMPNSLLPVMVSLPPKSIAVLKKYALRLTSGGLTYWSVITKFELEKTKNQEGLEYSRVGLSMEEQIPKDQLQSVEKYRSSILPSLRAAAIPAEIIQEDQE